MRPKYVVIKSCKYEYHVADINVFEEEKEMVKFVESQNLIRHSMDVYERQEKQPWFKWRRELSK